MHERSRPVSLQCDIEPTEEASNRPALLSLFSGCGGLDEGFVQAGFRVGAAYEIHYAAARSYSRNHGALSIRRPNVPRTHVYVDDLSRLAPTSIVRNWTLND